MQNKTSNLVYVASLNEDELDWSELTFKDIVVELGRYFHPVGCGYPKTPPNYVAFRYWGRLQRIHHVESYTVFTEPHELIPQMHKGVWDEHFLYELGPLIEPGRVVRTGKIFRGPRRMGGARPAAHLRHHRAGPRPDEGPA